MYNATKIKHIRIYTDGSCQKNPGGPGGWGVYIIMVDQDLNVVDTIFKAGTSEDTTNNKMELQGAIEGLKFAQNYLQNTKHNVKITVYTDSQYVSKGINDWYAGWLATGRLDPNHKNPVKNIDLWNELIALKQKCEKLFNSPKKIAVMWIKAHETVRHDIMKGGNNEDTLNIAGNNAADRLACGKKLPDKKDKKQNTSFNDDASTTFNDDASTTQDSHQNQSLLSLNHTISIYKMHALGNDFVLINAEEYLDASAISKMKASLAQSVDNIDVSSILSLNKELIVDICSRHKVGADQIGIFLYHNNTAWIQIYNQDGGKVNMCVNILRCLSHLINILFSATHIKVGVLGDTPIWLDAVCDNGEMHMKKPQISLPINQVKISPVSYSLKEHVQNVLKHGAIYQVNVGNKHLIIINPEYKDSDEIKAFSKKIMVHPEVANMGFNINFLQVNSSGALKLQVFENGVGLTLACGSGAIASAVSAHQLKLVDTNHIVVQFPLGDVHIALNEHTIKLSGASELVFHGKYFG